MSNELPFFVRRVRRAADMQDVCALRQAAYGDAFDLSKPDELDKYDGQTAVFMAVDKLSGDVVGTVRLQMSRPLAIEASIDLGPTFTSRRLAEVTRLAVADGAHRMVLAALMKALYLCAYGQQVQHLVVGARKAELTKLYRGLQFVEVAKRWPLKHAGGLPHDILALDVHGAHAAWKEARTPLLRFMLETYHPDIEPDL